MQHFKFIHLRFNHKILQGLPQINKILQVLHTSLFQGLS